MVTHGPQETQEFGRQVAAHLKGENAAYPRHGAAVYCLTGELGAGKTTFLQGFARGLGITSRLLSPTFIIVRRYGIPGSDGFLYHLDLYRVSGEHDLEGLGIREMIDDHSSVVVIEWAERLGRLLPARRTDIGFEVMGESARKLTVTPHI